MANLQAIGIDGLSPIYLWAEGSGTALDPYKSNFYAYQGGAWSVSVSNFPSFTGLTNAELRLSPLEVTGTFWQDVQPVILTAGTNAIGSITNTGFNIDNLPDTFAATQSGTWFVNVSNFPAFIGLTNAELRENPVPISLDISSLATASNQTTTNNNLSSIDGKLPSNLTVNSTRLLVDGSGVTQPVSGTITANQGGTWNIGSITTLPSVILASESGYLTYRNTALSSTPSTVKGTAGSVMGWNFINLNTVPVYVKFYNLASGSVTVGTSAVALTILVPPSDGVTPGMFFLEPNLVPVEVFSTAISIVCVIGLADNSTTAPTTPIHVSVRYK